MTVNRCRPADRAEFRRRLLAGHVPCDGRSDSLNDIRTGDSRDGAAARAQAETAFAEVAALIERTGAVVFRPRLCEWPSELAGVLDDHAERTSLLQQARTRFEEFGAPLQVNRLQSLIDAVERPS